MLHFHCFRVSQQPQMILRPQSMTLPIPWLVVFLQWCAVFLSQTYCSRFCFHRTTTTSPNRVLSVYPVTVSLERKYWGSWFLFFTFWAHYNLAISNSNLKRETLLAWLIKHPFYTTIWLCVQPRVPWLFHWLVKKSLIQNLFRILMTAYAIFDSKGSRNKRMTEITHKLWSIKKKKGY